VVHDQDLLDRLSAYASIEFDGTIFRATRQGLNPLAPSLAGGRWAVRDSTAVLYTSLERDGAIAEIAFHLALLDPLPSKPVSIHRLRAGTRNTLRLLRADLVSLGVDWSRYDSIDYPRTQQIGSAVAFLECDGLIAPSARWTCENLMIFTQNHGLLGKLDLEATEPEDWISWARTHDRI
jgi:hypothetical protein